MSAVASRVRMPASLGIDGVEVIAPLPPAYAEVLTPDALAFVATLARAARLPRLALLRRRELRQRRFDAGERPDFLPETAAIREAAWTVSPLPADLRRRRVEITGPVERKMVINALNSGADVFMADFEDATAPTWQNVVEGQLNLRDAVRREITFTARDGRFYQLNDEVATLVVRPRGWHLDEKHVLVDGRPVPGGIFDFGLYFFHNAHELIARGSGPYFYLPKLQSHLEARLWNDVFVLAQRELGIPRGTIKATVLVEYILAAFEMDEILWELREHAAGLNSGRWDYIFSAIKTFRTDPARCYPDRSDVTMTTHAMRSYAELLVKTCHRRGAMAIGGMAAQIPVRNDEQANATAFARVRADKEREASQGYDGTWVAHPGLVPVALDAFGAVLDGPNQLHRTRDDVHVSATDLLAVPRGQVTAAGLRTNVAVSIRYLAAWLSGNGCVPISNLMEDAATAEISRAQLWQWIRHGATLDDGRTVDVALVRAEIASELAAIEREVGEVVVHRDRYDEAAVLLDELATASEFVEFLTVPAYQRLA